MKVSLLRCMCLAVACTQLLGCGDRADSLVGESAPAADADGDREPSGAAGARAESFAREVGDDERDRAVGERAIALDCPELDDEVAACGQISIKLKGSGSSCRLGPTASDLTRPPSSVRFDCSQLRRGPDGYDFDELGHITLMGDTCDALQTGGPHRVTLVLACGPG